MIRYIVHDFRIAAKKYPVLLGFILIIIIALFVRAWLGVDLTDESYYFTQVLRLISGDRLFADIWDTTQTQGIPLLPFFGIYTKIVGYDGLILYGRILMLALNLVTACFLYYAFSTSFSKKCSALVSLSVVAFAPGSLLTVSYNNLLFTLMLLGVALSYSAVFQTTSKKRSKWVLVTSGIVHALMIASYPPVVFAIPFLVAIPFFAAYYLKREWKFALWHLQWYVLGLCVVVLGLVVYVTFNVGLQDALYGLKHMFSNPGMDYATSFLTLIIGVLYQIKVSASDAGLIAYAFLVGCALYLLLLRPFERLKPRAGKQLHLIVLIGLVVVCVALAFVPSYMSRQSLHGVTIHFLLVLVLSCAFAHLIPRKHISLFLDIGITLWIVVWSIVIPAQQSDLSSFNYALLLSMALPVQISLLTKEQGEKFWRSFLLLIAPSIIITATITLFSSGSFFNGRHGLQFAGICAVLLKSCALDTFVLSTGQQKQVRVAAKLQRMVNTTLLPALVIIAMVGNYYHFVYRDEPISALNTVVSYGPAKGLYTTPDQAEMLDQMAIDLRTHSVPDGNLLVLENCPYAYGICDNMKTFATSTWVASMYSRGGYTWIKDLTWTPMFDYMAFRHDVPDVIFYYEPNLYADVSDTQYGLHTFIQENYTCVLQRPTYWIYNLKG